MDLYKKHMPLAMNRNLLHVLKKSCKENLIFSKYLLMFISVLGFGIQTLSCGASALLNEWLLQSWGKKGTDHHLMRASRRITDIPPPKAKKVNPGFCCEPSFLDHWFLQPRNCFAFFSFVFLCFCVFIINREESHITTGGIKSWHRVSRLCSQVRSHTPTNSLSLPTDLWLSRLFCPYTGKKKKKATKKISISAEIPRLFPHVIHWSLNMLSIII